jgi:hypothetical protein
MDASYDSSHGMGVNHFSLNFSDFVARHISRRRGMSPRCGRAHRLQRRELLPYLRVRNGTWHIAAEHASSCLWAASDMQRRGVNDEHTLSRDDGSMPSAVRPLSLCPGRAGHESHSSLRSPGSAHVVCETCLYDMAHHRFILGCPALLGPAARGYPWRGHGHTGGRTTTCSPDT